MQHPPNSGSTGSSGTTTYTYKGDFVTVVDPAANYKRYYTNAFGNLWFVVDQYAAGEVGTGYSYNLLNQLTGVAMSRAMGYQQRTFEYNAEFRLRRTDAKNQRVEYVYDAIKRIQQVKRFKAGVGTPDPCQTVNFAYDNVVWTGSDGWRIWRGGRRTRNGAAPTPMCAGQDW